MTPAVKRALVRGLSKLSGGVLEHKPGGWCQKVAPLEVDPPTPLPFPPPLAKDYNRPFWVWVYLICLPNQGDNGEAFQPSFRAMFTCPNPSQ